MRQIAYLRKRLVGGGTVLAQVDVDHAPAETVSTRFLI